MKSVNKIDQSVFIELTCSLSVIDGIVMNDATLNNNNMTIIIQLKIHFSIGN
jgi:hypothetical protein